MYFVDALKVLLRRWYVVVVGVILMAAAGAFAVAVVPTEYQASGQLLLLLPPEAAGDSTPTNPLLNMQDGLIVTGTLIAGNVVSKDTQQEMVDQGFTSEYSVSITPGAGPLIVVSAGGTDPVDAVETRDEVIRRLNSELAKVQDDPGIPPRLIIHATELSVTKQAEVLPGSKIRALAVIGGVGTILTLIVAFALDRRPPRRKRKSKKIAVGDRVEDTPRHVEKPPEPEPALPTERPVGLRKRSMQLTPRPPGDQ